jgi:hypothetical protein
MTADMFAPYASRFAPVAIIPSHTPDEALEELEYAVGQRGFKAIMLRGNQERPIPSAAEGIDRQKAAWYCDTIALDSPYDYEPLWKRCVELGVGLVAHSAADAGRIAPPSAISPTTTSATCRIEPAPRAGRFWGLVHRYQASILASWKASWACQMCLDLIEHWEKRRRAGLQYPSATKVAELHQLIDRYGDQRLKANSDAIMNHLDVFRPDCSVEELSRPEHVVDDFEAAGINSKEDVRAVFSGNFYFGCEADDRATMWAFDPRMGVRLRPVFSSDFTHFDVPDFREVIPEAFEMVEKGFVTEQDFREFTFTNAARLHTRNNPDFFKSTVVEQAVANELGLKTPLAVARA